MKEDIFRAAAAVAAMRMTPERLKESVVAQLFAWDDEADDYVRSDSQEIKKAAEKAAEVLHGMGVMKVIDKTTDAGFPEATGGEPKLFVDLQYLVGDMSIALEGYGYDEDELTVWWEGLYGAVKAALGEIYVHGTQEKNPGLPSDPDETLWWDGSAFTSEEPED